MRKRFIEARNILCGVSLGAIAGLLGTILGNDLLKYLGAMCQMFVLLKSILVIRRFRPFIDLKYTTIAIGIIAIYPLTRIFIFAMAGFDFKSFTDALLVNGAFYQLVFPGFAVALLVGNYLGPVLLYKYAQIALPVGALLMLYAISDTSEFNIGIGHAAITNCFIPAGALAFYPYKRNRILLGWIAIALMIFLSSRIFSRSYTLVGFYMALLAAIAPYKAGNKKLSFSIFGFAAISYLVGGFAFFSQESMVQDVSIAEKYQFDSLFKSIERFMQDGDFIRLFFWEGNSRADILIDAFKNFSWVEWLFGRGLGGTYVSFTERKTIEIEWAQETFRWGLLYTLAIIYFFIRTIRRIKKGKLSIGNPVLKILSAILLIKFLDSFVFGLPQATVYNMMVFWGIMSLGVKKSLGYLDKNKMDTLVQYKMQKLNTSL